MMSFLVFKFLSRPEVERYLDTPTEAFTNPKKLDFDKKSNIIWIYIWKIGNSLQYYCQAQLAN